MTGIPLLHRTATLAVLCAISVSGAWGQVADERCPRFVAQQSPRLIPARYVPAALAADELRVTYVGHSTFLIETSSGVRIATDYNDHVRPTVLPHIVTMNRAHSTHYTEFPSPDIVHVLRGWSRGGEPARHDLQFGDVWVRNVPTNIRDWGGGTLLHGNSIFVFENAGLCIAHLGHLHHTLTPAHLDELGRIDVVMVPVDGTMTLNVRDMVEVLRQIKAPVAIPMHIFGPYSLERFLEAMGEIYHVEHHPTPSIVFSRALLPAKPTMFVLPGR